MYYYLTAYLVGIVITLIVSMIRAPDTSVGAAGIVCILWPIMIVYGIIILWLDSVDWDFDLQFSKKLFGRRKPNDGNPGFAITLFFVEFLFWKKRTVKQNTMGTKMPIAMIYVCGVLTEDRKESLFKLFEVGASMTLIMGCLSVFSSAFRNL